MVQSFGQINVPANGTPVRATSNLSAAAQAAPVPVQSFMIQAAPENSGLIYVYSRETTPGDDRTTRAYLLAILGAPGSAVTGPFYGASYAMPNADGAVDLRDIWIDGSANDQKAIVSGTHNRLVRY